MVDPLFAEAPPRDKLAGFMESPMQVGIERDLVKGLATADTSGVWTVEKDGSLRWRAVVRAPGAAGLRVHFPLINLPGGGELRVAGADGVVPFILTGRGPLNSASTWSAFVGGDVAYLEYRGPAGAPALVQIDQVAFITDRLGLVSAGVGDGPERLFACEQDVSCFSVDPIARDSVALILFQSGGGTFVCSGGLLNDTIPSSSIGWFLTANHCINTAEVAATLDAIWFFQTPACDGTPPDPASLPRSLGSTLQANSAATDFSLLRLAQDPHDGQGLAGWNAGLSSPSVTAIHHPGGSHKRLSYGELTLEAPVCNPGLPSSHFWYLDYTLGITEGGSSGSPIFDDQWRVTGQLFGSCSFAPINCDNPRDWNAVYGKFSQTYPYVCTLLNPSSGLSGPIYVKHDATGANDGTSWDDAFTRLDDAIGAVCGAESTTDIWVAQGEYRPGPPGGSRLSTFQLTSRARVFGGFRGDETTLSPDPIMYPTVLSGDLNGDDAPGFANRADNVYHVLNTSGTLDDALVAGFTVRGGQADGPNSETDKGGAVWNVRGEVVMLQCNFTDNFAVYAGGAVCNIAGGAVYIGCGFDSNSSRYAGAAANYDPGTETRYDFCAFTGNSATSNGGAMDTNNHTVRVTGSMFDGNTTPGRGGASSSCCNAAVTLDSVVLQANYAGFAGGAVSGAGGSVSLRYGNYSNNDCGAFGGAVVMSNGTRLHIANANFIGSDAGSQGGALYLSGGVTTIANTLVTGNRAASGAGIYFTNGASVAVGGCSIVANTATADGGGIAFNAGVANVDNSILWANADASGTQQPAQFRALGGVFTIGTTCVQGWSGSLGGVGNFGGDPLFLDMLGPDSAPGTGDEDLRVRRDSSVIDQGRNSAIPADELDLDGDGNIAEAIERGYLGDARRIDDPVTPDGPFGPAPVVDVGAHEFVPPFCLADWDANGVINSTDVSEFINDWFEDTVIGGTRTDVDMNGVVNSTDVSEFINQWFSPCP